VKGWGADYRVGLGWPMRTAYFEMDSLYSQESRLLSGFGPKAKYAVPAEDEETGATPGRANVSALWPRA
jgi:hypothetical protein